MTAIQTLLAALLISTTASANAEPIRKANPPGVAKPVGAYSHLALVPPGTKLLYLAGQVGMLPDGTLPSTVEEQLIQAYENVGAILASQGAGPEHIVKVMIYASFRPTDMSRIREHRISFFKGTDYPPSTWVYVSGLVRPEFLVEVEAIAAVPASSPADRQNSVERSPPPELRAAMAEWNAAMGARDAARVARLWAVDTTLWASGRTVSGATENLRLLEGLIKRRPDLAYSRARERVEVASDGSSATEYGRWSERWSEADGPVDLAGTYWVRWRRNAGRWLIAHEAFAPSSCSGGAYCRK